MGWKVQRLGKGLEALSMGFATLGVPWGRGGEHSCGRGCPLRSGMETGWGEGCLASSVISSSLGVLKAPSFLVPALRPSEDPRILHPGPKFLSPRFPRSCPLLLESSAPKYHLVL